MKLCGLDENGFPLNIDISKFYNVQEYFIDMPYHVTYILNNLDINMYMISNWGRIYNKYKDLYLPKNIIRSKNNYVTVALNLIDGSIIDTPIHRLVCAAFNGVPCIWRIDELMYINHIDGVKWHNEPYNLEWVTPSQNTQHAHRIGIAGRSCGENNGFSNLTDEQYLKICELTSKGFYPNQINKIMNLEKDITNIAQKIRRKANGNHFSDNYDFSNIPLHNYSKFSEEDVINICNMINNNMDDDSILLSLGYDVTKMKRELRYLYRKRIRNIRNGKSFKNLTNNLL